MSTFLNKIIYLSQTDYDTLAAGTSVTHGGVTLTGLEDDIIYLTDGTITSDDLGSYVIPTTNGGTGLSSIGTSGQVLKVNSAGTGLEWGSSGGAGTVTSVQVQATSPVQSSTSTAQTSILNTTISLASAYGDTQNPYGSKTANYILAAPNGSAGNPSFRAMVAADLPSGVQTSLGLADTAYQKPSGGIPATDLVDDYVNVTGDTMTGPLAFVNSAATWPSVFTFLTGTGANNRTFHFAFSENGKNMDIGYDYDAGDGAGLGLRSKDYSDGAFYLYAKKDANKAALNGTYNGVLTWNSRRVVTAVNNSAVGGTDTPVYITSSGYATSTGKNFSDYLPLAGGTMTGDITGNIIGTATNITGVAAVANGGTGLSSIGTAGQVLKVNSNATALEWGTDSTVSTSVSNGILTIIAS